MMEAGHGEGILGLREGRTGGAGLAWEGSRMNGGFLFPLPSAEA